MFAPRFIDRAIGNDDPLAARQGRGQGVPRSQLRAAIEIPQDRSGRVILRQLDKPGNGQLADAVLVLLGIAGVVGRPAHEFLAIQRLGQCVTQGKSLHLWQGLWKEI